MARGTESEGRWTCGVIRVVNEMKERPRSGLSRRGNSGAVPIDPLQLKPLTGSSDRLEVLYGRHHRRLSGLAASVMVDRSVANEMVRDCVAALADPIEAVENPEGYLQRSEINLASASRVKRRRRTLPSRPIQLTAIPEIDEMCQFSPGCRRVNVPWWCCGSGRTPPKNRSPTCSTCRSAPSSRPRHRRTWPRQVAARSRRSGMLRSAPGADLCRVSIFRNRCLRRLQRFLVRGDGFGRRAAMR